MKPCIFCDHGVWKITEITWTGAKPDYRSLNNSRAYDTFDPFAVSVQIAGICIQKNFPKSQSEVCCGAHFSFNLPWHDFQSFYGNYANEVKQEQIPETRLLDNSEK